jgi:pimeloyl-ACP methyl ester carboxylesterase
MRSCDLLSRVDPRRREHDVTESPRVVLVHGSMDSSASFRRVEAELEDVLRYDRRGYGRSGRTAGPATFDEHVDDLLDVLNGAPAVVVGHSLGGTLTLAAAARAPHLVESAVVYEVPMPWLPWWPPLGLPGGPDDVLPAAERFLRRHMGDERWDGLPARSRAELLGWAPAWAAELRTAASSDPPPFDPCSIEVPVVVGYGTATDERHARSALLLADELPNVRLERIAGAGHAAHRTHPREFADLVRSALRHEETAWESTAAPRSG